jgi:hypothetical protein
MKKTRQDIFRERQFLILFPFPREREREKTGKKSFPQDINQVVQHQQHIILMKKFNVLHGIDKNLIYLVQHLVEKLLFGI